MPYLDCGGDSTAYYTHVKSNQTVHFTDCSTVLSYKTGEIKR